MEETDKQKRGRDINKREGDGYMSISGSVYVCGERQINKERERQINKERETDKHGEGEQGRKRGREK